jgi:hypothetical protein
MMEGETSQNTVTGGIFDGEPELSFDETTEGTETEMQSAEAQEQPEQGAAEQEVPTDFLTIRYNKADKKLTKEEAIELAQKGMNYDHIQQELQSYREGPIGKALKAYADAAGMSVEKYAEMMMEQQEAAEEKKALEELQERYPDAPDELLKEHVRMQREGNKAKAETAAEARQKAAWSEALAEYPSISADKVPQDVLDAVAQGKSPLMALREHEIQQLRAENSRLTAAQETKQKQDDNRARSIGSAAGVSSGGEAEDDFLAGMASRERS